MITTETEALEAIRAHHRALEDELKARVAAVSSAAAEHRGQERATAALVTYLAEEVLPHAEAEEHTIYPAAAKLAGLTDTVSEMIAEHRTLSTAASQLATATGAATAAAQAEQIAALFGTHVARENELLLPALLADADADLVELLDEMHQHTEAAADPMGTLLSLLLTATTRLARAGEADRASQIAAAAWAAVREPRPDLAVRVTAALHGLTRQATPARAAEAHHDCGCHDEQPQSTGDPILDVRALAPAQRHESIFATYRKLAPGDGFVLVNDHDPKPLRYQFEAEHAGQFSWDELETGPAKWRVRIGRPAAAGHETSRSAVAVAGAADDVLDVREIPHWQRHELIFSTFKELAPGSGFVLVNDHDPVPLRYQFEAQYPALHTWTYLQEGPARWRVRIGRTSR